MASTFPYTIQIILIVLARLGTFVCIRLAKFELEKFEQ